MKAERRCWSCVYFDQHRSLCRRHAPILVPLNETYNETENVTVYNNNNPGYNNSSSGNTSGSAYRSFDGRQPTTNQTDWCGEHKYDKRKAAEYLLLHK